MSGKFLFTEYTYNPSITDTVDIERRLTSLGFQCIATHVDKPSIGIWTQGFVVLLVVQSDSVHSPGVTGLGLVATDTSKYQLVDDLVTSELMLSTDDLRYLVVPEKGHNDTGFLRSFIVNDDIPGSTLPSLLVATRGIITSVSADTLVNYFGFKHNCDKGTLTEYLSNEKRFSFVHCPELDNRSILICDSSNVFSMLARCSDGTFTLIQNPEPVTTDFGDITYKIKAFRCFARGNKNTYNIEFGIKDALPNLDMIVRTRQQFVGVDMSNFKYYIQNND